MTDNYISSKRISGEGSLGAKILIVGDFPNGESERDNRPISGDCFNILEKAFPGVLSQTRIMNVSEYKPANNDSDYLEGSPQLRESLELLKSYIVHHPPELIITLGELPLRYLTDNYNINQWRGSPLKYKNIPLLCTYHPNYVNSAPDEFSIFAFDLMKAFEYYKEPNKSYLDNFTVLSDPIEQRNAFDEILAGGPVAIDIETKRNSELSLLCVGFGLSNNRSICYTNSHNSSIEVLRELIPQISQPIYHNAIFDIGVLRHFHDIPAKKAYFDTMIAQHIIEPELPKGLDFLCSTLTWRPCYWAGQKFDEEDKSWSDKRKLTDLYLYNQLDTVVTYEAYEKLKLELESHPSKHVFDYEMDMLEVAMHIGSTGFYIDQERRALLISLIEAKKKHSYVTLCAIAQKPVLITSPKQVQNFLYNDLGLPPRKSRTGNVTTDEGALVGLISYCKTELSKAKTEPTQMKWKLRIATLKEILNIREYEKLLSSYVNVPFSTDGRMRGRYKVSGTKSGRWAGEKWYDKTGLNPQTLPRKVIEK